MSKLQRLGLYPLMSSKVGRDSKLYKSYANKKTCDRSIRKRLSLNIIFLFLSIYTSNAIMILGIFSFQWIDILWINKFIVVLYIYRSKFKICPLLFNIPASSHLKYAEQIMKKNKHGSICEIIYAFKWKYFF